MPFIKGKVRKKVDAYLDGVIGEILGMDNPGPVVSYVILKLLIDVYGGDVNSMIEAIGVIEETKMTYYTMHMLPLEQRIVLRRWVDSEGKYE
jgi:hypothetical protein